MSRIPCENTCSLARSSLIHRQPASATDLSRRVDRTLSGAEGARTPDLRAASATLFQLSYSPKDAAWPSLSRPDAAIELERGALLRPRSWSSSTSRIRLSSAVRRTRKSSGGALFQLAQQLDRLVEAHRERRAALGEALDRDLRGAELADRVLEADQLREVAERADLDLDQALEELLGVGLGVAVRRWRSAPAAAARLGRLCASASSCARRLTSTASRSAFIRIRVAWPRACAWISSSRAETASSEAMLRSWRSLASRSRSLRPRISRSRSITMPESEAVSASSSAAARQLASARRAQRPDPRVARRDRRIHFGAAVAEERPLEATHARHRRGALGRHLAAVCRLEPRRLAPELLELVALAAPRR